MYKALYPKEASGNYHYRAELLSNAQKDKNFEAAIRDMCRKDCLFWLNSFGWVYEPRKEQYTKLGYDSPHLLFLTWDYQDDFVRWLVRKITAGEDGVLEKSRDMGASWLVLAVYLWFWLFGGAGNDFIVGSRKEEFVDKSGVMDALFPKIRYMLYRQPEYLLPLGFKKRLHDTFMRLINPETGSYIKGEANNKNFGTGGRYKSALLDEFAKWDFTDEEAWQSLSDASPSRIAVSSAKGTTNHFFKLRSGEAGEGIDIYTMIWKLHPLKDEKWYENERKRRTKEDLAAEVDIDYTASIKSPAYLFKRSMHVGDVAYNKHWPIELTCDFNVNPMCWAIAHDRNGMSLYFDEIAIKHRTTTSKAIEKFCRRYSNHEEKKLYVYGDASGGYGSTKSKESDYDIIRDIARQHKWEVILMIPRKNPAIRERLNATNKRLQNPDDEWRPQIKIDSKCKTIINSFEQTQSKDEGIDKSQNIEHMSDAVSYREVYKYPANKIRVGMTKLY